MFTRSSLTLALLTLELGAGCASSGKRAADTGLGSPVDLIDYVDPMISTGGIGFGVGSGYPGALVPFGLVKVSPDTSLENGTAPGFHHCSGYHADDTHIEGFSHLHMHGTGLPAYGFVTAMPVDGWQSDRVTDAGYRAAFDKATEVARPGQYTVVLQDPEITVDLTATEHTALHRYRFGDAVTRPTVIFDLGHTLKDARVLGGEITIDTAAGTLTARTQVDSSLGGTLEVWVAARFERPPVAWGVWADGIDDAGETQASGTAVGAWLEFDDTDVALRVALSTVDAAGAQANLEAEHDGFDMDTAAETARETWRTWLAPFQVWGGSERDRTIFATAVYHVLHMPTRLSDVDNRYRGLDGEIHTATGFRYHSDFSLWDTYRTTHPLYTLAWPSTHLDLLHSLSRMAVEGGALPRWPAATEETGVMIGEPAAIVIAEAWQKGLMGFDEVNAFRSAVDVALGRTTPPYGGRPMPEVYMSHGYYPSDRVGRSVSWTQEVAIADHALAQMARDLGDPADVAALTEQAGWWRNLYDPAAGWFHGRLSDGTWEDPPRQDMWEAEFTEGNARQYLWLVPHDPEGLFEVLGGRETALTRLDEMMEEGAAEAEERTEGLFGTWYWHGNEPGLHIPWLFALAGDVEGTRYWVDFLLDQAYDTTPDGLAGNDDGGTLSAWAVFAAMGIYPLAGTDRYVLGRPRFDRVELHPAGGLPPMTFIRSGDGTEHTVTLNGEPWDAPDIRHHQLWTGNTLEFR